MSVTISLVIWKLKKPPAVRRHYFLSPPLLHTKLHFSYRMTLPFLKLASQLVTDLCHSPLLRNEQKSLTLAVSLTFFSLLFTFLPCFLFNRFSCCAIWPALQLVNRSETRRSLPNVFMQLPLQWNDQMVYQDLISFFPAQLGPPPTPAHGGLLQPQFQPGFRPTDPLRL